MAIDWSQGGEAGGRVMRDDVTRLYDENGPGQWVTKGASGSYDPESSTFVDNPYRNADWNDYKAEGLWGNNLWDTNSQDSPWSKMGQGSKDYFNSDPSKKIGQILSWAMGDQPVNQPLHNDILREDGTSQAGAWGPTWAERFKGTGMLENPEARGQLEGSATAYGQHLANPRGDIADMIMPALATFFFGPMAGGAVGAINADDSNSWGHNIGSGIKGAGMGWLGGAAAGSLGFGAGGLGMGLTGADMAANAAAGAAGGAGGGGAPTQGGGSMQYADAGNTTGTMTDFQYDAPDTNLGRGAQMLENPAVNETGSTGMSVDQQYGMQPGQDMFQKLAETGIAPSTSPATMEAAGQTFNYTPPAPGYVDPYGTTATNQQKYDDTNNYPPGTDPVQDGGAMDMNGVNSPNGSGDQDILAKLKDAYSKMKDPMKLAGSLGQMYMNRQQRSKVEDAMRNQQASQFDHKQFEGLAKDYMDPTKRMAMLQQTPGFQASQDYVGKSLERKLAGQGKFSQRGQGDAVSNNWAVPMLDAFGNNAMKWDNQLFGQIKDASGMGQPNQQMGGGTAGLLQSLMSSDKSGYSDLIGALRSNNGMLPEWLKSKLPDTGGMPDGTIMNMNAGSGSYNVLS